MVTPLAAVFVYGALTQAPAVPRADVPAPTAAIVQSEVAPGPSEGVVQLLKNANVRFELLDEHGERHKAKLDHIEGDEIVLRTRDNSLVRLATTELQRSDRQGDSPWDGTAIGFSVGVAFWLMTAQNDQGAGLDTTADGPDDFTLRDTVSLICTTTALGYIFDRVHVGKHRVLVGPMRTNTSKPRPALTLNIAGPPRERRLQVGYRMSF
jgi:hypothetical protein